MCDCVHRNMQMCAFDKSDNGVVLCRVICAVVLRCQCEWLASVTSSKCNPFSRVAPQVGGFKLYLYTYICIFACM